VQFVLHIYRLLLIITGLCFSTNVGLYEFHAKTASVVSLKHGHFLSLICRENLRAAVMKYSRYSRQEEAYLIKREQIALKVDKTLLKKIK
jgi:hypothetical protein